MHAAPKGPSKETAKLQLVVEIPVRKVAKAKTASASKPVLATSTSHPSLPNRAPPKRNPPRNAAENRSYVLQETGSDDESHGYATDTTCPSKEPDEGPATEDDIPSCPTATRFKGVFTNEDLQKANLGILLEYRVLVCLTCTDQYGYSTIHPDMAPEHVRTKHNPLNDPSINSFMERVQKDYGLPHWPDPPKQVLAPFEIMPISRHKSRRTLQACADCPPTRRIAWLAYKQKKSHYEKEHPNLAVYQRAESKPISTAQSWYGPTRYRRNFEVDESLLVTHTFSSEESAQRRQAAAAAYRNADPANNDSNCMTSALAKDMALHVAEQDWPLFFEGKDTDALLDIAELPDDPADPLFRLRELCGDIFVDVDKMLSTINSKFLELAVDAHTDGRRTFPFGPVGKSAKRRYARIMVRFVAALVRTAAMHNNSDEYNGDPKLFLPYLTDQQKTLALKLGGLLDQRSTRARHLKPVIQSLLVSCFAPGDGLPDDCEHMCNNKYHDFVHTFCALFSIQDNGMYKGPEQIVPVTTALQYIIRSTLLMEVLARAETLGGTASAFGQLSYFLKRDNITPFGCLQTLRKRMMHHERSARKIGKLQWSGEKSDTCHFEGTDICMDALRRLARHLIDQVQEKLEKVLRGVSLGELEANLPEDLNVFDHFTDSTPGYSFLNDKQNQHLIQLAKKLETLFVTREDLTDDFWDGETLDNNGRPMWYHDARVRWLQDVAALSDALAVAMHIWGGQPARGAEFHNLSYCNPSLGGSRLRNMFYFNKRLVYILWYSKVSRMMGTDHAAIHALPDDLSRLAMITLAAVFPLATRWTGEVFGDSARKLQQTHMFCSLGKVMGPQKLSYLLTVVSERLLGVKLGLRAFRHLIIAVQREHLILPSHYVATNIFQRQARHTQRVSRDRYAVQTEDAAFTGSHTFKTFVEASTILHSWFNGQNLTPSTSAKRKHHQMAQSSQEPEADHDDSPPRTKRHRTNKKATSSSSNLMNARDASFCGREWDSDDEESDIDVDEDLEDAYSEPDSDLE
ncbi:hypothetical protein FRC12_021150 [Ceratobasidium sp. 428]|nr:hypothetical protein FRC12_021150 [Ceratobasidium sp. 428]